MAKEAVFTMKLEPELRDEFYEHYGFQQSPQHPMTLMLRLNTVQA